MPAIALAWLELALGQYKSCIEWLLLACEDSEPYLASARVSPAYDPIRGLPQFKVFESRLGSSGSTTVQADHICGPMV